MGLTSMIAMVRAALLSCVLCAAVQAADWTRVELPLTDGSPVEIEIHHAHEAQVGSYSRITGYKVRVTWSDWALTCDRAVLWVNRNAEKIPGASKEEQLLAGLVIYAEGSVRFEGGGAQAGKVVTAHRLLLDFEKRVGMAEQAVLSWRLQALKSFGPPQALTFRGRAKDLFMELDQTGPTHLKATDIRFEIRAAHRFRIGKGGTRLETEYLRARAGKVEIHHDPEGARKIVCRELSVTDCEFCEPHYDLYASTLTVEAGAGKRLEDSWLTVEGLSPRFFGIPWFYVPWIGWKMDWQPLIRFRPGHSSKFGTFIDAAVGIRFRDDRRKEVGRVWIPLRWYDARGVAGGLSGKYKLRGQDRTVHTRGEFDATVIHDRGDRRDEAVARLLYPLERSSRWRTFLFHRQHLPLGFTLDGELNAASDRNFLLEFYENEWKTKKPPESYLLLRNNQDSLGFAALGRFRLNAYQEQVEYLPRLRFWLLPQDLGFDGVNLSVRTEVSHARQRTDDGVAGLHSRSAWRFDVEPEASTSFLFGPVGFEAFLRPRFTAFEISALADERSVTRTAWTWGFKAVTWAWRTFRLEGAGFDLHHEVIPEVEYINVFFLNRLPADLVAFDEVETLDRVEKLVFRLTNRLQALPKESEERLRDLLFLELAFEYFMNPERDNSGNSFSPLLIDVRSSPVPGISAWFNAAYDLNRGRLDLWNGGVAVNLAPVTLSASTLNVSGALSTGTLSVEVAFSRRWSVRFHESYDFWRGDLMEAGIRVRRNLHCWVLDLGVVYDRGEKNLGFSFSFLPALFAAQADETRLSF